MNDKTVNSEDPPAELGIGIDSHPPLKTPPAVEPCSIDSVILTLEEEEIALITSAGPSELSIVIRDILTSHTEKFERLCHHFIDSMTRYTLDEGSLEIEDCEMDINGSGCAHCVFTASMYAGCRDMNDDADPRDDVLDVALDRQNWTITLSTTVPDNDPGPEEF